MEDPIKVLWKFKNKYNKIQYNTCIFIGNLIPTDIIVKKILKKIKTLNLYDSLLVLTGTEIETITKFYGEFWYKFFFNHAHIIHSITAIKSDNDKKKSIITKYSEAWYNNHILNLSHITINNNYNYSNVVNKNLKNKYKTLITSQIKDMANTIDYSVTSTNIQKGGNEKDENDEDIEDSEEDDNIDDITETTITSKNTVDTNDESEITYEEMVDDDSISNEELLNLDKEAANVSVIINDLITSTYTKYLIEMAPFDTTNNDNMYDIDLKNVYNKTYVYNQYIYKDDSIQTIKHKITCGLLQDPIFTGIPYIIPSRTYLWSEYEYYTYNEKNKIIHTDKVMLGQKWINKTELLKIAVEPSENIKNYESLHGNLKYLRDNIFKYGSRIKREHNDTYILDDYKNYMTNNEIFMLDIYHELGLNYYPNEEIIKNIYSVYVKIYYNISQDDFKQILDSLNKSYKSENNKILQYYQTVNNDITLENEITHLIEKHKFMDTKYNVTLAEYYITQVVIHCFLNYQYINTKLELFRIFDNYVTNENYLFVQYHLPDNKYVYKFYNSISYVDRDNIMLKWFEFLPYGINFKIKVSELDNNYVSVSLNEYGNLEYKTQWKEHEAATMKDIQRIYHYVRLLVQKLNKENTNLNIKEPTDEEFKFAFINTIQKISFAEHIETSQQSDSSELESSKLKDDKKLFINHNDLSNIARYFYPYIAIIVAPRKRQSKVKTITTTSKYGTYLRYKRISKYENESKIEHRILYFLKNYEYVEKLLVDEIAKQFNITETQARDEILKIKAKFPKLKKSRNVLKKLDVIPKYKLSGVNIDIQGKSADNYKLRISGVRSNDQLHKIISFIRILLHIYVEIYIKKNKEYIYISEKLKQFTFIAKRRGVVDTYVDTTASILSIKQITKLDKVRLGYKPEKGQHQWSRICQNSGTKIRRPEVYTDSNLDDLINQGYSYNKETNDYEKVYTKDNKSYVLRAIKLADDDGVSKYYICNPETNKDYKYVGFLSKSSHPSGLCMPCCFKTDQYNSTNKIKRNYYLSCINKSKEEEPVNKISNNIYILYDAVKIQENRFSYLPKYLDIYLNLNMKNTHEIKNNYLKSTTTGYFFKYGSPQTSFPFLNAIGSAIEMSVTTIKATVENHLTSEDAALNMQIFTSLNSGDIRTQFNTIDNFLYYLRNNFELDYTILSDIISIPGVLYKDGLNIIIFNNIANENSKDDYNILCKTDIEYIDDKLRKTIILIKDDNNYYPIFQIFKRELSKQLTVFKTFNYEDPVITTINNYYDISCINLLVTNTKLETIKIIKQKLIEINQELKSNYIITAQIIDQRNRCKYIIVDYNVDLFMLPVYTSGILWNVSITNKKFINSLDKTLNFLTNLYNDSIKINNLLDYSIQGFIYLFKDNDNYSISYIIIEKFYSIEIENILLSYDELKSICLKYNILDFTLENLNIYDEIDSNLINNDISEVIDERRLSVNKTLIINESYEIFKLTISNYLKNNEKIKKYILNVLNSSDSKIIKRTQIKLIIYKIVNNELYELFKNNFINNNIKTPAVNNTIVDIKVDKDKLEEKTRTYKLNNFRNLCSTYEIATTCNESTHCKWSSNSCVLNILPDDLIVFVNRITEELIFNELKSNEILLKDLYYLSDVINSQNYTNRENQKIVKSANFNIKHIFSELFGADNIPQIGRKRFAKSQTIDTDIGKLDKIGNIYSQIVNRTDGVFRAYANSWYWIVNYYSDMAFRNLGYCNPIQSELTNLFKSFVIDYLLNKNNYTKIISDLNFINLTEIILDNYLQFFINSIVPKYLGIIELYILNQIHNVPILIYNAYNVVILIIDNTVPYVDLINITIGDKSIVDEYYESNYDFINIKYALNDKAYINSTIVNAYSLYFVNK